MADAAVDLCRIERVCNLTTECDRKVTVFATSSKHDFVIMMGNDCFYYTKASEFLQLPLGFGDLDKAPTEISEHKIFKKIEVSGITSLHISSCETCLAINCSDHILFYSLKSILEGVGFFLSN